MPEPSLQATLYRLLHDAPYRAKLEQGRLGELGLSAEGMDALRTVDTSELAALGRKICGELAHGQDGDSGLRKAFPRVFAEAGRLGLDARALVECFLATPHYERYRLLPYAGRGIAVEEAFHDFLLAHAPFVDGHPANRALVTHEGLAALVRLLVLNPDPAFDVGNPRLRHNGCAWVATLVYEPHEQHHLAADDAARTATRASSYLYAATARASICGPVNAVVAAIVHEGSVAGARARAAALADAHATAPDRIVALAQRLARLGVIAES